MKIGKEDYPGFVMKPLASGDMYYGWEPSAKQRRAGWKSLKLSGPGIDLPDALRACVERNKEIGRWIEGGATPRAIKAHTQAGTFGALLDRYEAEKLPLLAKTTQNVDMVAIRDLRIWAGKHPVNWITQARVLALREALMKGVELDGPGHHPAYHRLATLRRIFTWATKEASPRVQIGANPAAEFGLRAPAPRQQVWEDEDFEAFAAAAAELDREAREGGDPDGDPDVLELVFAVEIAAWTGQREADIIRIGRANWTNMTHLLESEQRSHLAGNDGRVMGIQLKQGKSVSKGSNVRAPKTGRWVGVPVAGDMRARIELRFADNARRTPAVATLLLCHSTGAPWNARHFIRHFDEVRQKAVAMGSNYIGQLQYRDLRRTCVVRLGRLGMNNAQISAITGHKLETIEKILETYMPRDAKMAAGAVIAMIGRHGGAKPQGEQKEERA